MSNAPLRSEFDCSDCHVHVIRVAPAAGTRCAGCEVVASIPDEAEREGLRQHLLRLAVIGIGERA